MREKAVKNAEELFEEVGGAIGDTMEASFIEQYCEGIYNNAFKGEPKTVTSTQSAVDSALGVIDIFDI